MAAKSKIALDNRTAKKSFVHELFVYFKLCRKHEIKTIPAGPVFDPALQITSTVKYGPDDMDTCPVITALHCFSPLRPCFFDGPAPDVRWFDGLACGPRFLLLAIRACGSSSKAVRSGLLVMILERPFFRPAFRTLMRSCGSGRMDSGLPTSN